jgi:nitroimidazol reductase NimA-like FMN-containing flavoprotein (pyridoxamine 5'-phosphate oxidase superfamily)
MTMSVESWEGTAALAEEHECWSLLRSTPIGRLAVRMAGNPEIFPVNHVVDHGTVVFRTGKGTKLASATLHPQVAYEADGYDLDAGVAWSVVVKGRAEPVRQRNELLETVFLPLYPWHGGPKPYFVRIVPDRVSLRRFSISRTA